MNRCADRDARPPNQRLALLLWREPNALFTFLYGPGLEATNWHVEQANSSQDGDPQRVGR